MSKKLVLLVSFVLLWGLVGKTWAADKAWNPDPTDLERCVLESKILSWEAGADLGPRGKHAIYFGEDRIAVYYADPDSAEFMEYKLAGEILEFDPVLVAGVCKIYYWRIDELGAGGDAKGDVWSFMCDESAGCSSCNRPPVAEAGADQEVPVGYMVTLDGSASSDVDGDPISYFWEITSKPAGSTATLSNVGAEQPSFRADLPGEYVIRLVVTDVPHGAQSVPDEVQVSCFSAASDPDPANWTVCVPIDVVLSWEPADCLGARGRHGVYFGTNQSDVENAPCLDEPGYPSPEFKEWLLADDLTYDTSALGLQPCTPYYWRIDEACEVGGLKKGNVWSFTTGDSDSDGDGVCDCAEDGAPNGGDGNGDTFADSTQSNVASLPNTGDGEYVTLFSPAGTTLAGVSAIGNPSPDDAPAGVDFPFGFFEFEVRGLTPGASTTVTIMLPDTISTYWKYGQTSLLPSDHWYEFLDDGTTGAVVPDNIVVLKFVDGERGDDVLTAEGKVVDAGGPGFVLDIDANCPVLDGLATVNFGDFSVLASGWLLAVPGHPGDIDLDGIVDGNDLAIIGAYWLSGCPVP